jgi:hypothetical protein
VAATFGVVVAGGRVVGGSVGLGAGFTVVEVDVDVDVDVDGEVDVVVAGATVLGVVVDDGEVEPGAAE